MADAHELMQQINATGGLLPFDPVAVPLHMRRAIAVCANCALHSGWPARLTYLDGILVAADASTATGQLQRIHSRISTRSKNVLCPSCASDATQQPSSGFFRLWRATSVLTPEHMATLIRALNPHTWDNFEFAKLLAEAKRRGENPPVDGMLREDGLGYGEGPCPLWGDNAKAGASSSGHSAGPVGATDAAAAGGPSASSAAGPAGAPADLDALKQQLEALVQQFEAFRHEHDAQTRVLQEQFEEMSADAAARTHAVEQRVDQLHAEVETLRTELDESHASGSATQTQQWNRSGWWQR
jgi:hypothetical protein